MALLPFASPGSSLATPVTPANGGTGTSTVFTQGSVVFAGASGIYNQDNANFFWDSTNHRLGIGTTTPGSGLLYGSLATRMHVYDGTLAISAIQSPGASLLYSESASGNALLGLADTAATSNFRILDILSSGGKMIFRRLNDAYGAALANSMTIDYTVDTGGRIGIQDASPSARLSFGTLAGNAAIHLYNGGAGSDYGFGIQSGELQSFIATGGHFSWNSGGDLQTSGTNELMRLTSTGRLGIGATNPATKFNLVDTEDFRIGHTGATGDLLAGMAMYTAGSSTNFSLFGNGSAGGNTGTLQLMYTGGSGGNSYYSAVEITNTGSGFGSLLLMKTGGTVTLGGGTAAGELRFLEPSGSGTNYTAFKVVAQSADITYSLPPTVGASGTVLTDVAGNGVLTWAAPSSGGITTVGNVTSGTVAFDGTAGTTLTGTTSGMNIFAQAQGAGNNSTGATLAITAGAGGSLSTGAAGGPLNITGGTGNGSTAKAGGLVTINGGVASATGDGGGVTLTAGTAGSTSGAGGDITINPGPATAGTNGNAGKFRLVAKNGKGTGNGSTVSIVAGNSGTTGGGSPGTVTITSGNGGAGGGDRGADLNLTSGNGDGAGNGGDVVVNTGTGTAAGTLQVNAIIGRYNSIVTTGLGVPAIFGKGRATGQTAANTSVATYTVGAADGSFEVSANMNITTSTTFSINIQVTYTDETNTAQTLTLPITTLAGAFVAAVTNVQGVGPYETPVFHIRCKASTAITIKTAGTFTSVTYNIEGIIKQTA